jgi:microcystin degradation protein MlrC
MRVFVACLSHETSSFSPIPTSRRSFEAQEYHRPTAGIADDRCRQFSGYGGFVRAAQAHADGLYASTYAVAQPSGPCARADYESLRDEILDDLRLAGPFDAVLLFLHGAQMADGCDDCEGDLLARARRIVGAGVFIGALLDLHANVSPAMLDAASALVACRHYPHTDFDERAEHLYRLGRQAAAGATRPVMHYLRVPMLGMFYTTEPRLAAVNEAAFALQGRPGVLSVSLIHGFPYTDNADLGAGVLVVSDGERPGVKQELQALAASFFDARDETATLRLPVATVLDRVTGAAPDARRRPFVIADACDNPGGGAGSDSTFILAAILERGLTGFALGLIWDPVVAQFAADAGVGARLQVRLGGKTGPRAGAPLDVQARVLAVRAELAQIGLGFAWPMGLTAALEIAGNVVVVCSARGQVFHPSCFTDVGVDPASMRALVVKSSQHFHEHFAPLAREVLYCETPAAMPVDVRGVPYAKVLRPVWPLDPVVFDGT